MNEELNIKGLNMYIFRFVSVLLMLFSLTTPSFAEFTGDGSKSNPFIIDEPDDIVALRDYLIKRDNSRYVNQGKYIYVKQTTDIDLEQLSKQSNKNSSRPPLPLSANNFLRKALVYIPDNCFLGVYDGGGFTIKNWILESNIVGSEVNTNYFISMFGKVGEDGQERSIIKNLNIEGFELELAETANGDNHSGYSFLASSVENADIINCHIKDSKIQGDGHFEFGAIAATTYKTKISDCSVINCVYNPSSGSQSVGSICGVNNGDITNCFAYNVTINGDEYLGGLVGENTGGTILNCGFNGKIGASDNLFMRNCGGLCGKVSNGSFINCFTVFDNGNFVWNNAKVFGSFVGDVERSAVITLKNCYAYPQIKTKKDANVDFFVGRDESKDKSNRTYESLYCYENGFGVGFKPNHVDDVDFSESYKQEHNLLVAPQDFMRSGCLAELLAEYHNDKLKSDLGDNQWREDFEFKNDTLPVLHFMTNPVYDNEEIFCHPGIYTLGHTKNGNTAKLNGQLKYIKDEQVSEGWIFGFEIKTSNGNGSGAWKQYTDVNKSNNGNKVDFTYDLSFSTSKTTVFRSFTYHPAMPTRVAHGKIDTICVGTSVGPDPIIIEGCDSVKYDGRLFTSADNGTYTNSSNELVTIKIGENRTQRFLLQGKCGDNFYKDGEVLYDESKTYVTTFTNETGCTTTSYKEVKLYPTISKDSLKVFELGEMSYTYKTQSGQVLDPVKVEADYVLEPRKLIDDIIYYTTDENRKDCPSTSIFVKYVIPIKETKLEDYNWSCKPVVYNGVTYTKETVLVDTVKTPDSKVYGGMLYELKTRHIKVAVPDTMFHERASCNGYIEYDCPMGKCETTEPFYDTVPSLTMISNSNCPTKVDIIHHVLGEKVKKDTTIFSCGEYVYTYKGSPSVTWDKSGNYVVTRNGNNPYSCDDDTIYTFHVTIGESTIYSDTTIHGCGKVSYKTLSGDFMIFDKNTVYEDVVKTDRGCLSSRKVNIYIHKFQDKSPILPITGCAPYVFKKLNGDSVVYEKGTHIIKDTIRSMDGCGCDSIVKTTTLILEDPTTLREKVVQGCNEVTIEGSVYSKDTSFVVKKVDTNILSTKLCRTQFQPYTVKISPSVVERIHVDTCGTYVMGDKVLNMSDTIVLTKPSATGCDDTTIYDVRIIEPLYIDSVVYACDNYVHKFFDGRQEIYVEDGKVIYDILRSKVCQCDSIIRKVTINISTDKEELLEPVTHCGTYEYIKRATGKKILIESSQTVEDTIVNKYGCNVYYKTDVTIIPVNTLFDTVVACKEYHTTEPVFNFHNLPYEVEVNTPSVESTNLIFLKPNALHPTCNDTTKLFLTVHGVGNITAEPVVECDSFIYSDFDGTKRLITSNTVVVDTLKSKICDCDSIILTTNVTINHSVPLTDRKTNTLRNCDSVVYVNAKGIPMTFKDSISLLDTFQMKNTGCDSVVIVDIQVPKSTGKVTELYACGDTTLYDEMNGNFPHFFDKTGVWRQVLGMNSMGCDNYKEWIVNITPTPLDTLYESGCGELTFREETFTSLNEQETSFSVKVSGATKCDTIHNYILTVYPKFNTYENYESCDSVVRSNGDVFKETVYFQEKLSSVHGCDSIVNVNIVVNPSPDIHDIVLGCYEVEIQDPDYNGNQPVYVHHDSVIYINKLTDKGCDYQLIKHVQVGYPTDSSDYWYECFDSEKGYASFRDLKLTSDTVIYDTITSSTNRCGAIVANNVHLIMPVHDTIYIDSCLHITYEGIVYLDSAEVVRKTKTIDGCDTIKHYMLNVNKCFPYPILVNKYNWILVCNDNILDEDKFKNKSNVKYNWYKNERLVSTTSDSYFTEDKELNGCYQVGIIVNDGIEYVSDVVCIDENHGYSISPQPNPVEKLQPITIICDFPVEGVAGTLVEVFNMTADKVYVSTASSNEIVIPGMSVTGYYLVRLTTVTGKVLTAKFMVK